MVQKVAEGYRKTVEDKLAHQTQIYENKENKEEKNLAKP